MPQPGFITIRNARENNLRSVSIDIPKNQMVLITGVSGSGKSSLVFDVLNKAAESQYLGSFSSRARQFLGKLKHPDVEMISGLTPAISISQGSLPRNPRSTVGTLTGIYDHLRLLFARCGKPADGMPPFEIDRSLFSFNSPKGACPSCKGLGIEDRLDPELLVADASKSLRDRALVITAPNGYIIYSQVTMDVMDQVCKAEGFSVDIPWKDLTPAQKQIILFGSDKLEIPFGKHTLESRMRWSGITAKPREMGFYKGIIPVMEEILKRDRNKNILRFVRSGTCSKCKGSRLNDQALSVRIGDYSIADLAAMQINQLVQVLESLTTEAGITTVEQTIITEVNKQLRVMNSLSLGYLTLNRESGTLSGGETQRLKLAVLAGTGLSNILYLFDEPSVGLHPVQIRQVIRLLHHLRDQGNTVVVIEHEEAFIEASDWLIDMGPGAGVNGGEVLCSLPVDSIPDLTNIEISKSRTLSFYTGKEKTDINKIRNPGSNGQLTVVNASAHNLKNINVTFKLRALNLVSGVSGAGKSTLVQSVLGNYLLQKIIGITKTKIEVDQITGWESVKKVISIDQSPIGKSSRSNPATYTGLFDPVRELFASQPLANEKGFDKSRFSFNTAGGRCEACEGSGYLEIGMHFMGNVEVLCEKCEGMQFDEETLQVRYKGKNIHEVLDLFISEAVVFFSDHPKIPKYLKILNDLGLGYLKLGQRSSTLSGGEAQRIKIATELAKTSSSDTLYLLDEPTTGLHQADVGNLLRALQDLIELGNTVIVVEHHLTLLSAADHIVDLGPESGDEGGYVVATGTPDEIMRCESSHTGQALKEYLSSAGPLKSKDNEPAEKTEHKIPEAICFQGVTTHNLKNIDVSIPHHKITVVTGISGSGKSTLAFDTIFAEGKNRFLECFSTYIRSQIGLKEKPDFSSVTGLTPVMAIDQQPLGDHPRSTVGTLTGIYDLYRLLFSRIGKNDDDQTPQSSSVFSFNHQHGACPECKGLGYHIVCDPEKLITHPALPVSGGAMNGTKTGKFYGDPHGQYMATLRTVGQKFQIDFSVPWKDLSLQAKHVALFGTGEEIFNVSWQYKRGEREGEHHFRGTWPGLTGLVKEEYDRKHADHRGSEMIPLMKQERCIECNGTRLGKEALSFRVGGLTIDQLSGLSILQSVRYFSDLQNSIADKVRSGIAFPIISQINEKLNFLIKMGVSYLSIDRPVTTLSTGEGQRIKLSALLGSGLTGITCILDEPTTGLHPSDTFSMLEMVRELNQRGNTMVVVEHDRDTILSADHIIDLGPGAGNSGGRILAKGTADEIMNSPDSVTGPFLRSNHPGTPVNRELKRGITIRQAFTNNLKRFDIEIPAGGIIAVTGVSGSGKSSLIMDTLYQSYLRQCPVGCDSISGFDQFTKCIVAGQRSSFSSSTGAPGTYTGIFDKIREIFASTPEAIANQFGKNQFSFLNKEGRCESCQGSGKVNISMDFLPDIQTICETCKGKRYQQKILSCEYSGKSISDVLEMTISEARQFFSGHASIERSSAIAEEVGLGYLQLGQSLDTLSGGEAQRLSLATELMKGGKGKVLYIFEEPSNGLHFLDKEYLLSLFHRLADQGHTIIVIEHDHQIISQADWVVDLGPEGGDKGGNVIFSGRVDKLVNQTGSLTGNYLKRFLSFR